MEVTIDTARIEILIDEKLYSSQVVHKCFYWFAGKYSVDIKSRNDSFLVIISGVGDGDDLNQLISNIRTRLIDFKTREIIAAETKYIREMLIAKAFAHGDEYEEVPPNDIEDPAGFDPTKI